MFKALKSFGLFMGSIKGLWFAMSLAPAILAFAVGIFEHLPWAAIIAYTTVALAAGLAVVALGAMALGEVMTFFTTRTTQNRIMRALNELGENVTELDLPTAAAIWAGTASPESVERHTYFRGLKNAVDHGKIRASNLNPAGKAYAGTRVDFESLKDFWRSKGVIR